MWADFRNNMASRQNFDLRKLPQLHERLIENSQRDVFPNTTSSRSTPRGSAKR